jgi:DNA-binding response OmpR family regulator
MDSTPKAPRLLVVEDDPDIAYVIRFMLERDGFAVDSAADGREADARIDAGDPPQLVVLDVMLPFVDGFQLLRKIRATKAWSVVPVIMLTAKSQGGDIVRSLDAGANDYVIKPFQPEELLARVRRLVRANPES